MEYVTPEKRKEFVYWEYETRNCTPKKMYLKNIWWFCSTLTQTFLEIEHNLFFNSQIHMAENTISKLELPRDYLEFNISYSEIYIFEIW
jgi:hypothetical protein